MNDVERLAEALRRANAELDVDPNELTEVVHHARRRLFGRLFAVAALSAVGALLLLGGGLKASKAVESARNSGSGGEEASKGADKPPQHSGGKHGGGSDDPSGAHGSSGESNDHPRDTKKRHPAQAKISSKESTEKEGDRREEGQPNLQVVKLTAREIEVINTGKKSSGEFVVMVEVEPWGEEPIQVPVKFESLAPKQKVSEPFPEKLTCEKGGWIVAEIDPETKIEESEEGDNYAEAAKCEPADETAEKGDEKTQGEGESTISS